MQPSFQNLLGHRQAILDPTQHGREFPMSVVSLKHTHTQHKWDSLHLNGSGVLVADSQDVPHKV